MLPKALDKVGVNQLKPLSYHVSHVSKGSIGISIAKVTYFFPVFKLFGFRFTDLKNENAYSAGAPAYE